MPPRKEHLALQTARLEQQTEAFKKEYAKRAGIERIISQAVRAFELRRSRYLGLAKTHLQHLFTAIAINLVRFDAWLNEVPHAKTRTSRFAALAVANASTTCLHMRNQPGEAIITTFGQTNLVSGP